MSSSQPQGGTITASDELSYFRSIPWCAAHLAKPGLTVAPVSSRTTKANLEDTFFAQTLKTPDTIRAFVCFYPKPEVEVGLLPRVQALVSLGDLVNGYGGIAHGGVQACVFDEVLSLIHPGSRWARHQGRTKASAFTAYLNTTYLKPVATPGDYLVTVWLTKEDGRKIFVEGVLENEKGEKLARAEALFVETKEKL